MGQGRFSLAEDNKVMSAIDMLRDQKAPSTIDGEKVLKHAQAAYDGGSAMHSTWKMGSMYLTEKKLIFFQGQNRLFDLSLDALNGVDVIERNWIPGKIVEQLRIVQNWGDRKRKLYVSVKKVEGWKEAIDKCSFDKTQDHGERTKRAEPCLK